MLVAHTTLLEISCCGSYFITGMEKLLYKLQYGHFTTLRSYCQAILLAITHTWSVSLWFHQNTEVLSVCIIRIHHKCEGRIEKSVTRFAVWHHEACRVMTNSDHEGRIFLSYPHTNNGFFFLLTTFFIYLFILK